MTGLRVPSPPLTVVVMTLSHKHALAQAAQTCFQYSLPLVGKESRVMKTGGTPFFSSQAGEEVSCENGLIVVLRILA